METVKSYFKENHSDIIIAISFILIALIGFGLGRLSYVIQDKSPITIEQAQLGAVASPNNNTAAIYVASKNGTAYYLPDCPGASRIKEENKIWFSSQKEAESLGYKPAANCPGL